MPVAILQCAHVESNTNNQIGHLVFLLEPLCFVPSPYMRPMQLDGCHLHLLRGLRVFVYGFISSPGKDLLTRRPVTSNFILVS